MPARDHVRVARALTELPEIRAALGRGAVSYSQVRALTRVATAENETDLLELAEGSTVRVLERAARAYRTHERLNEAEEARRRHEARWITIVPNDVGGYAVNGDVDLETGNALLRATDAARDAQFREEWRAGHDSRESSSSARRVDALRLVAERALQAGFGPEAPKTLSGTRAERYQVLLFVEPETLRGDAEPGMSEMEDGTRAPKESARRIACDCSVVRVTRDEKGEVLDAGRRQRTVSPALRRALEARDRGCRFPGCGLRFTDGHHIVHWADGGETSLGNTVLLCGHHHRLMHEGGWTVSWWGPARANGAGGASGRLIAFTDPRGQVHVGRPPPPSALSTDPLSDLVRATRGVGRREAGEEARRPEPVRPLPPRWRHECQVPDEVWFRATEAALSS